MKRDMVKGYFFIIISAVIFGCMPLGAKLIYADGINAMSLVFLRNALSIPVLAVLTKRHFGTLAPPKGAGVEITMTALAGGFITPLLLFSSFHFIPSGTATVFHFIYPAATVLGGVLFLRDKIRRGPAICIVICTLGIALFYDPSAPIHPVGSALALTSGLTYAAYILLLSHTHYRQVSGFKFSLYVCTLSAAAMLVICLTTKQLTLPTKASVWVVSIIFSLVLSVGATVLFQKGALIIGGQRASILSTFEPITSLVVGFFAFHESVGFRTIIGSFLVILAAILIAIFDAKPSK